MHGLWRFMEPEGSLPRSKRPTACNYLKPPQSNSHPHPTAWRSVSILSSQLRLSSRNTTFIILTTVNPLSY
jgi:hypothetical protein